MFAEIPACTIFWYVLLTVQIAPVRCVVTADGVKCAEQWQTMMVGPMSENRDDIVAMRQGILDNGFQFPSLIAGPPDGVGERRIAPGAIRECSARRMCCYVSIPLPDRPPCEFPDHDNPFPTGKRTQ